MKQIVVISGKGGTGKTVITAAFAALAENAVLADCDVDAADLHLLLTPEIVERHEFRSGLTAMIDNDKCMRCRQCVFYCRFDAISSDIVVDRIACEGCGFCQIVCPAGAITMQENVAGEWFISQTRFGPFVHARLGIAEENSGKLVALVRQKAKEVAEKNNAAWVIVDGAPGIGCPVIASLSGIDAAVVVTEPTLSGLHDAGRVIQVARHFKVPVFMIINKYDLNHKMTHTIAAYCHKENIPLLGTIAFDKAVVNAVMAGKTIIEYPDVSTARMIREIWKSLSTSLREKNEQ